MISLFPSLFPPKYCFFRSVTDPRDGKRVALKKMPNVFQNLVSCKRVFRELKMLCFFKHDNVSAIGVWGKLFTRLGLLAQLRTRVSSEGIEFSCSFMSNSEQKVQCGTLKYLLAGFIPHDLAKKVTTEESYVSTVGEWFTVS